MTMGTKLQNYNDEENEEKYLHMLWTMNGKLVQPSMGCVGVSKETVYSDEGLTSDTSVVWAASVFLRKQFTPTKD